MKIDLRDLRNPLADEIRRSLSDFISAHPNTRICTVGLWGDGFHGTASLHLDTPDHSEAFVQEWMKQGSAWYGNDVAGLYCNSCWDFPHCVGEYSFPNYPDLYLPENEGTIEFIAMDGSVEHVDTDDGDEALNRIVFPFLKEVVAGFQPFDMLARSIPFRVGVQMRDSECAGF